MVKKAAQATPNLLLRQARLERGWTQKDVADRIGAPLDLNVTRWERGTSIPSAFYVQRLCQLFDKSASELGLLPSQQQQQQAAARSEAGPAPGPEPETELPWNVPFARNAFFTGRAQLLDRLHEYFKKASSASFAQTLHTYALTGLGGIGKTQAAVEYAFRYQHEYRAVFWVRAASRETLIADFVSLAGLLLLPGQDAQDQTYIIAAVKRWLAQQEGWLLILDNADDLPLVKEFLPTGGAGDVLLTTRAQATGRLAVSLPVEKLGIDEAMLLLLRQAKLLEPDAALEAAAPGLIARASDIVEELDGLPIALAQAGAYIEDTGCSLADYLALYKQRRFALLTRRSSALEDYPYTVASTWSLSFQQVEETDAAAAELLRICAFLDPDFIPESILTEATGELGAVLGPVAADPFLLNEAIEVLRRYSLIKRDPEEKVLNLHRLVQVVLKDGLDEAAQRLWAERAVRAVSRTFPEVIIDNWGRCELYLPHVQACARLIDQYGLIIPETARLFHHAGLYLRERGQYNQAELYLERALGVLEQAQEPDAAASDGAADIAGVLNDLARLYQKQGKYEQAEPLLLRALALREHILGPSHPDTVDILNDLGSLLYVRGQFEQAKIYLLRAEMVYESSPNPQQSCFADTFNNLAMLYQHQGYYALAEAPLQRALAVYEQVLGPEHPYTVYALNNMAYLSHLIGKYSEAERLHQQVLSIQERKLGSAHPDVAITLNDLASLYVDWGRYEQVEALCERALLIAEQMFGKQHYVTAAILNNLAILYVTRGQYSDAKALFLQALAIREQSLGPEHPRTAATMNDLAGLFLLRGKFEPAEALLQRALAIYEHNPGQIHPEIVVTLDHLGDLAFLRAEREQAGALYQRALEIAEQMLGHEHPTTAIILDHLARLRESQNDQAQAAGLKQRAQAIRERAFGLVHDTREL